MIASKMPLTIIIMMCYGISIISSSSPSKLLNSFMQCPYSESSCVDDITCSSQEMSERAGYFCPEWPFYSGGFAECCDENQEYYHCTHSIYSYETNNVFCDFWYMTQTRKNNELQFCDCKVNNGKYCTSWICTVISNYDFEDKNHTNTQLLEKLLLTNVEIFGVDECGTFDDHLLVANNQSIKQWCYKYDDFKSCYCVPEELQDETEGDNDNNNGGESDGYCKQWICHKYLNNAKNDLSIDDDYNANASATKLATLNSTELDMRELSTKISHEEFKCAQSWSPRGGDYVIDTTECAEWTGNLKFTADAFAVQKCETTHLYPNYTTFELNPGYDVPKPYAHYVDIHGVPGNVTFDDLRYTYSFKWECHEQGMDYRNNKSFLNFYLSTLIWSIGVGLIGLSLIFWYMRYKYITLSSFFCVQGWFFFIFGSIAAVHGGFASFFIYFILQFAFFIYIGYLKCKYRGKQPYGAVQRYDFDPIEESMSRPADDDNL